MPISECIPTRRRRFIRQGADNNCAVLVPEGYHPVVSAPGYTTYYLNVLAGSAQTLANQDDPRYAWINNTYKRKDNRLPLY